MENASRLLLLVSRDISETTAKAAGEKAALLVANTNVLQLEHAGVLL
jgi:hypothetical protein